MEEGNVEALAEIPLWREKNGKMEEWKDAGMKKFDNSTKGME